MGFEPIIQPDGTWRIGNAGRLTYLDQWRFRPVAYQNSGSRTLDGNYWTIVPPGTLPNRTAYLVYFAWSSSGAPWLFSASFMMATVAQNGESSSPYFVPSFSHADNGSDIYALVKAGNAYGGTISGLDINIENQNGRVGSWTVYLYNLGVIN